MGWVRGSVAGPLNVADFMDEHAKGIFIALQVQIRDLWEIVIASLCEPSKGSAEDLPVFDRVSIASRKSLWTSGYGIVAAGPCGQFK